MPALLEPGERERQVLRALRGHCQLPLQRRHHARQAVIECYILFLHRKKQPFQSQTNAQKHRDMPGVCASIHAYCIGP